MSAIDARLSQKRLVFTAATGRCGTGYLARMLRMLSGVDAVHEPDPDFSQVMRTVQSRPAAASEFWLGSKLPAIACRRASVYVETSHLVCKGFWEPLQQLGVAADLLILTRPAREVASSLYRLNTIPGRTEQGLQYYLAPSDPVLVELPAWAELHDYELCYWYCLEIERRQAVYESQQRARGGLVVRTSLAEITQPEGLETLLEQLRLPAAGAFARLRWSAAAGRVVNKKRRGNRILPSTERLEQMEQHVQQRIALRVAQPAA